jgi:hypothetical protein
MRAHLIENGVVVNTIEVKSLDYMPGLVEATEGGIGWTYANGMFTAPEPANFLIEQAKYIREQRNQKLNETDWTQTADAPVDKTVWATYRQALRDITTQTGFPLDVQWPVKPTE